MPNPHPPASVRGSRAPAAGRGDRALRSPARSLPVADVQGQPQIPEPPSVDDTEMDVYAFPVQEGKIQPPLLPEETLRRDRLLDWMHAKTRSRLALIVADAGYGKTTLLADWTRRTRTRVLWYRLDEHDRDWMTFLRHLVAAGREVDPGFAATTAGLLIESGAGLVEQAAVVRAFLAEVRAWVTTGTVLILDDYHAVDEEPEIRDIVRSLVMAGPERLTVVISSRTRPTLPVARLRAVGEASELSTDDLRFDSAETRQLFHETYGHPLEQDLLDTLTRMTDGWAATLRLTESAVRGRPRDEVRAIIRGISGREGDLHDYLAEEVVDRMTPELRAFAERCSVLEVATIEFAAAAGNVSTDLARTSLEALDRAGLISRRGRTGQAGRVFHPLVRSFLEGRLLDHVGEAGVRETHQRVGLAAEGISWAVAARHYVAAARNADAARVMVAALPTVLGSGGYLEALEIADGLGPAHHGAWVEVIRAHSHLRRGEYLEARASTSEAHALYDGGDRSVSVGHLMATEIDSLCGIGQFDRAAEVARSMKEENPDDTPIRLGRLLAQMHSTTLDGMLAPSAQAFRRAAENFGRAGHTHYQGICWLDAAWTDKGMLEGGAVLDAARLALEYLEQSSSGVETVSAATLVAWGLAHGGEWSEAKSAIEEVANGAPAPVRYEALVELAEILAVYGDQEHAARLLREADSIGPSFDGQLQFRELVEETLGSRTSDSSRRVGPLTDLLGRGSSGYPGLRVAVNFAIASRCVLDRQDPERAVTQLEMQATRQGAPKYRALANLLRATLRPDLGELDTAVLALLERDPALTCYVAEHVMAVLDLLPPERLLQLADLAVIRWPDRWRPLLRTAVADGSAERRLRAGRLLERVGTWEDIRRLRELAKHLKGRDRSHDLGRALARRLAPKIEVDDLGRIAIRIGGRELGPADLRPKALALLCFLGSQRGFAATREQVMEALWPEYDPEQAVNSLHQTVYFLRRSLEHPYDQDTSPGYLQQDGELLRLDTELVDTQSRRFRDIAQKVVGDPDPDTVDALSSVYTGPFAADFLYDDWAILVRDALHARYVDLVERAIRGEAESSHYDRAISIGRRVLEVDPGLDEVERFMVRLFRLKGSHAAAAEQYAHYAASLAELGLEAPPIENL